MKKTIKIIDLLIKKANDEEMPVVIKYENFKYYWIELMEDYENENEDYLFQNISDVIEMLNDEVEIIVDEEDKKIKKIKSLNNVGNCPNLVEFGDKQQLNNHILKDKINEIIDAINELKKGE